MAKKKKKRAKTAPQTVSAKKAAEVLAKHEKERLNRCTDRINKVLEEENCQFLIAVQGNNISGVQFKNVIVSKPNGQPPV